ncbi:hypothetical protein HZZ00_15570 [Streptomyces sp. NEAU-sy36]|uniref:hypothetical protein n=1 Tax=Streptomyces sp. NEAU-sy36 TaxID=2751189 RepID=UPI0015D61A3A|nr:MULTISPECIES: hypothetical protein [unclassified Streptomyces]QLJ02304.1 hypothetical protein HZZ00_15570 [Streptomyces sp. NEAU-sy36]
MGTAVRVRQLRATGVDGRIEVGARPPSGGAERRLAFAARAVEAAGRLVAEGESERAVVNLRRFLEGDL